MTTSKFDQQVFLEQLRSIEAQDILVGDDEDLATGLVANNDFSERLWRRATNLIERNELNSKLQRAAKLARIAKGVGLLVAALLGALAANLAMAGGSAINIYWLLLVLLGFNFVSMLLWLVGISFKLDGLIAGALARFTGWLPGFFTEKSHASTTADRAWLACHFGGRVGKWQLSAITHQLWLVYLLSGLTVVLLVLMARQYDIVWGTTILSDSTFVRLTDLLGRPLQLVGLATPSAEQVLQTRIGADHSFSAAHSNSWAQFLLGALLVYGILPRLLLWLWAILMRAVAKRNFKLDYYLPYYIALRQQLMPHAGQSQISDADSFPLEAFNVGGSAASTTAISSKPHIVPADARWIAVELGETIKWPPATVATENDFGQVNDRHSLVEKVLKLEHEGAGGVAIAVVAERAPDRGVQRIVSSLAAAGTQAWLVLMHQRDPGAMADSRLAAWYRLAEACSVPADHVIVMAETRQYDK